MVGKLNTMAVMVSPDTMPGSVQPIVRMIGLMAILTGYLNSNVALGHALRPRHSEDTLKQQHEDQSQEEVGDRKPSKTGNGERVVINPVSEVDRITGLKVDTFHEASP